MRNGLSFGLGVILGGVLAAGGLYLYLTPKMADVTPEIVEVPAVAPESVDANDPVLASVNGEKIRRSDIDRAAEDLPEQYQAQLDLILPVLIDRMIDLTLVDQQARDPKLEVDPQVLNAVDKARKDAVRSVFIENYVKAQVTPAAIQARYDMTVANVPAEEEVRARHILVESADEAKAIIKQLDDKADFAAIAKEKSIDKGSGAEGGDLGYFVQGQMVEPFAKAAFALKPGEYTKEPVQSQFGWHVILLEDRRAQEKPSLESMRQDIEGQLSQEAIDNLVKDLRAKATIERFNADGTPVKPEEPTAPSQPEAPAPSEAPQPEQPPAQ